MGKLRRHTISFANAWRGLSWAVKTQPNFLIHLLVAALALLLSWYLGISRLEWVLIVLVIFVVLVTELINTALESATDLFAEGHWSYCAMVAKDVSAAAVLTAAFLALLIGGAIFLPYIFPFFHAF
ncbi:MAG: diacylglycerol kinase family protein [bacterium]|nr:diacylglycerol kinase family protein [bacterium]